MSNKDYRSEMNDNGFRDNSGGGSDGDAGGTNRQYKDRLFKAIFGAQERKHLTLQLYNAMRKSSYKDPAALELYAIDNVVYMGMKNDVSFVLDQVMNLWEQQSTSNPNMPLRFLLYYAHLMERYLKMRIRKVGSIYSGSLVRIPTPRLVLLYNGPGRVPDYLYLSDAYLDATDPDVQARVRVININSGQDEILEQCAPLQDYTTFVETFRRYREQRDISDRQAASTAIRELRAGEVRDYLETHESEVVDMILTEYNEEEVLQAEYLVGKRAGLKEGLEQGLRTLLGLVARGKVSIADAMDEAADYGITSEEALREKAAEIGISLPE